VKCAANSQSSTCFGVQRNDRRKKKQQRDRATFTKYTIQDKKSLFELEESITIIAVHIKNKKTDK